ncbi:MAG: hypothetical protein ACQEP3_00100 [Patescibacteria group bacterium]
MAERSLVRTIYLYLFAGIGLILLIIGVVRFIDMGLKATIFKEAQSVERLEQSNYYSRPYPTIDFERYEDEEEVTEEELESLRSMIEDYEEQEEKWGNADRYLAKKQEEASYNLAFILVGFPLYLYHWKTIKKDN